MFNADVMSRWRSIWAGVSGALRATSSRQPQRRLGFISTGAVDELIRFPWPRADGDKRWASSEGTSGAGKDIRINFVMSDGARVEATGKIGDSLLDVVLDNNVDIDGFGACDGTLACSTCHLIFNKADFDGLPEKVTDEEMDMLDLAYDLTDTSRLGCQISLRPEMDGIEIKVPSTRLDAR